MKAVTYEQFLGYSPCWLDTEEGRERLRRYGEAKKYWFASDILELDISDEEKLWAVLRTDFLDATILHDFVLCCMVRSGYKSKGAAGRTVEQMAVISATRAALSARRRMVVLSPQTAITAERHWQVETLKRILSNATENPVSSRITDDHKED